MNNEIMNICGVSCYEQNGTAYLRLDAVARGLGLTTVATSGNEVIRWNRVKKYLSEFGFSQEVAKDVFIPENIFYRLAMKAKNETAEKFQALVADEIIPSIRKTGGYIAGSNEMTDAELMAKAVLMAQKTIEDRDKRIRELSEQTESMRPKALFADSVAASNTSILIGELAKILKQNGVDMGQKRLFQWMRDNGWLIRRQGTDYNMPTKRAMEMGLFQIKETVVAHSSGYTSINKTPKVTGKGQLFFINKFLGNP